MLISLWLINHQSVTRRHCDVVPTVTFPAMGHHWPLIGTMLYYFVTQCAWTTYLRLLPGKAVSRTRDLLTRKSDDLAITHQATNNPNPKGFFVARELNALQFAKSSMNSCNGMNVFRTRWAPSVLALAHVITERVVQVGQIVIDQFRSVQFMCCEQASTLTLWLESRRAVVQVH